MDAAQLVDLYIRRSKPGAKEISTQGQEDRGRAWAERNGLEVRHIWTDKVSGSKKDAARPEYESALKALADGEVKTLWSYKLDRFSRHGAIAVLTVLDSLEGSRVIFDSDGLDSSDPTHRRMIMWRAEDAKEEADRIGQRLRDEFSAAKDRGLWMPAKAPYGYTRTAERSLIPDQGTESVVQRIFFEAIGDDRTPGRSVPAIAKRLNADEIPSPTGKRWSVSTVYGMLGNPTYAGWATRLEDHKRVIYRNGKGDRVRVCEGLVSDAVFQLATSALNQRTLVGTDGKKRGNRANPRHLLTGLLVCQGCGKNMVATGNSYRCVTNRGSEECPEPAGVLRSALNTIMGEMWVARLSMSEPDDPLVHMVAERWLAAHRPDVTEGRAAAQERLNGAQAALQDLLDARYKRREFEGEAMAYYPQLLAEAEAEVGRARREIELLPVPEANVGFLLDSVLVESAWRDADFKGQRELLALAVDEVRVKRAANRWGRFDPYERLQVKWAA